ncbi:signal recognition particle protein, partial [bacterium]|nr:signal recognition particle protein [bacterium]
PELIDGSRRVRISKGSGTTVADVNRLVKQFSEMKKMMKQMGGKGALGGKRGKGSKSSGMPDDLAAALGSRLGPR